MILKWYSKSRPFIHKLNSKYFRCLRDSFRRCSFIKDFRDFFFKFKFPLPLLICTFKRGFEASYTSDVLLLSKSREPMPQNHPRDYHFQHTIQSPHFPKGEFSSKHNFCPTRPLHKFTLTLSQRKMSGKRHNKITIFNNLRKCAYLFIVIFL